MIFLFLLPFYLGVSSYMMFRFFYWMKHCNHRFNWLRFKVPFAVVYLFMALSPVIAFLLPKSAVAIVIRRISTYWIGIMLYSLLYVVLFDLLRLIAKHTKLKNTLLFSRGSVISIGSVVVACAVATCLYGIFNARNIKVNEEILSRARKYNEEIAKLARPFVDYDQVKGYEDILDITGTGVMGYISIPTIRVELPIYHGTSDGVLNVAVGHLQGSSLPVGGADTHSVISAHRGLPSAKLFSDLDKLAEGDEFTITVLKEVYTYEVEAVYIVLPNEMDKLNIIPGEDHVTLTTCTPYGVNSHRLLVRAKRVETADDTKSVSKITADAVQLDSLVVVPFVAIPLFVVLLVWWFVDSKRKKISHDELVAMLDKQESDDNVENLPDKESSKDET